MAALLDLARDRASQIVQIALNGSSSASAVRWQAVKQINSIFKVHRVESLCIEALIVPNSDVCDYSREIHPLRPALAESACYLEDSNKGVGKLKRFS